MSLQDCVFNTQHGYIEALCRGMKQGLLSPDDYTKLGQAENLEDVRSTLEETDYGSFMQDEPAPIGINIVAFRLRQKLADEFKHLRAMSSGVFVRFFDFIVAERMIDNLIVLLQGAINKASPAELEARCDPLGWFPGMRAVAAMDVSSGYDELYRTILVDTAIGPYVEAYLHELALANPSSADKQAEGGVGHAGPQQVGIGEVGNMIQEMDLEILRNLLKKNWLEDFHRFCETQCNDVTREVMGHILKTEADMRLFGVAMNTMDQNTQIDRNSLFPAIGYLYPEMSLRIRKAFNLSQMRQALAGEGTYSKIFDQVAHLYAGDDEDERNAVVNADSSKTFEDIQYEKVASLCEQAFEQQMHFGVIYAWVKLREQEIRNILWICEMVVMNRRDKMDQIIELFKPMI